MVKCIVRFKITDELFFLLDLEQFVPYKYASKVVLEKEESELITIVEKLKNKELNWSELNAN